MKKNKISVMLLVLSTIGLISCGGNNKPTSSIGTTSSNQSTTSSTTSNNTTSSATSTTPSSTTSNTPSSTTPTSTTPTSTTPTSTTPTSTTPTSTTPTSTTPTSTTPSTTIPSVETQFSEINSVDDLLKMKSGTNYKLMKDLDCSDVKWTLSDLIYSGIFDGNGHKISGMSVENPTINKRGLLFYQLIDAKIMNLTIANSSVNGNLEGLAIVCGLAKNVDFINIELSSVSVNTGTATYAGLLASRDVQGTVNVDRLTVKNNSMTASSQYFGGVFGNCDTGAVISFTNIDVDLTLKFTKDGSNCASILCGRDRGGITYNFENCLVDGAILGSGESKIGVFVSGDKSSTVTMKNCVASLDVGSNTADIYLGHKSIQPTIENCCYIGDRGNGTTAASGVTKVMENEINPNWYFETVKLDRNVWETEENSVKIIGSSANVLPSDAVIDSLVLNTSKVQKKFYVGDEINYNNLIVSANYKLSDGGTMFWTLDESEYTVDVSKYNSGEAGKYEIVVSSKVNSEVKSSYYVEVVAIVDFKIYTEFTKQSFVIGSVYNSNDLVVKAVLNNGNEEVVSSSLYNIDSSAFDASTVGTYTINVNYLNHDFKTKSYQVSVYQPLVADEGKVDVAISKDETLGTNEFRTFKDAFDVLNDSQLNDDVVKNVTVKEGSYDEKVNLSIPNVHLIGKLDDNNKPVSIITHGDAAGHMRIDDNGTYGTDGSATMTVNKKAYGFTCKNILIENTFDYFNDKTAGAGTQGVALLNDADKSTLINCSLTGKQDTLEAKTGRQYYKNVYIEGFTDFVFGNNATAYFTECEFKSMNRSSDSSVASNGGYVFATKGYSSNEGTDKVDYGYIINNCNFTHDVGVGDETVAIARPWGKVSSVVVMNSTLGKHISKLGYTPDTNAPQCRYEDMSGNVPENARFFEYNNSGDGAITETINGMRFLTEDEAIKYSNLSIIFGTTNGLVTYTDSFVPVTE